MNEDVGWEEILIHNAILFSHEKEGNPAFIFQI